MHQLLCLRSCYVAAALRPSDNCVPVWCTQTRTWKSTWCTTDSALPRRRRTSRREPWIQYSTNRSSSTFQRPIRPALQGLTSCRESASSLWSSTGIRWQRTRWLDIWRSAVDRATPREHTGWKLSVARASRLPAGTNWMSEVKMPPTWLSINEFVFIVQLWNSVCLPVLYFRSIWIL